MGSELKPCPFCGQAPLDDDGCAMCMTDDCAIDQVHIEAAAWNRRASPATHTGDLEGLVDTETLIECLEMSAENDYRGRLMRAAAAALRVAPSLLHGSESQTMLSVALRTQGAEPREER